MNIEVDMIEEHLDDEYQNSEISPDFATIKTQIEKLERKKLDASYNGELLDKLKKAIALLRLHVHNYQRIVIFNRRRARQRIHRKQCTLRTSFLLSLLELQIRFVEMIPLAVEPLMLMDTKVNGFQHQENNNAQTSFCSSIHEKEDSEKPLSFYHDIVLKFTTNQWLDTFHMSQNIFVLICSRLKTSLDNINMDLENWIAMCIFMFASGSKFCSVAMLFNVEKKFVRQSLFKFSECLLNEFSEKMSMPNTEKELVAISDGFHKASNMMPSVAGILSLFNVPNICDCGSSYICGSENIKVQVCIDNNLLFRKVETTSHKPTMFLRSSNEISLFRKKIAENCEVPYFIVAPDGYPLRNWLMLKYDAPSESWEYNFNKSCRSLNIYREVSLKRLFGRWHILDLNECILPESKSFIVKACCLLHNILEEHKEEFSLDWCKNFNPSKYKCELNANETQFFGSEAAIEKRNIVAKLMFEQISTRK